MWERIRTICFVLVLFGVLAIVGTNIYVNIRRGTCHATCLEQGYNVSQCHYNTGCQCGKVLWETPREDP